MTLTKAKIINDVHEKIGYPKKEAGDIVETLLELMKSTLVDGEDILISGFGKFCVKDKNARKGRNPATGDAMMLDKRRVITFRCSAALRNKINHK
ncbi:MAG: integration host factor subunit alpha [Deltaproteobacteria bacterium]|nr:MAG: integration host factor subunit alpha [Deltaproteobacteria bacterium]